MHNIIDEKIFVLAIQCRDTKCRGSYRQTKSYYFYAAKPYEITSESGYPAKPSTTAHTSNSEPFSPTFEPFSPTSKHPASEPSSPTSKHPGSEPFSPTSKHPASEPSSPTSKYPATEPFSPTYNKSKHLHPTVSELKRMHIKALFFLVTLIEKQAFWYLFSCHQNLKRWELFLSGKFSMAFENMKKETKMFSNFMKFNRKFSNFNFIEAFENNEVADLENLEVATDFENMEVANEVADFVSRNLEMNSKDLINLGKLYCHHDTQLQVKKIERNQVKILRIPFCHQNYNRSLQKYAVESTKDHIEGMKKEFLYKNEHKLLTITRNGPERQEKMESEESLISRIHQVLREMKKEFDINPLTLMGMQIKKFQVRNEQEAVTDAESDATKRSKGEGSQTCTILSYQQALIEILHTVVTEQALTLFAIYTIHPLMILSEKESFEIAESLMELAGVIDKHIVMLNDLVAS